MDTRADLLETFTWELRRAFRELAMAADRELEPLGITARDRALLESLAKESHPITLSELARRRSVSRQHIHQTLRQLADPEWVEQCPDPVDRRNVLLRLSSKGKAFWGRIRKWDKVFCARLAPSFQEKELLSAIEMLQHLRKTLHEDRQP